MNDDAFQTIAIEIAQNAKRRAGQPVQRLHAERGQPVVDDAGVVLEEPAEDEPGEHERQRPRQQQPEPHRPLDLERLVGQQRESEPQHQRARHGDDDVEDGVPRRMPEPLVVERARVVREAPPTARRPADSPGRPCAGCSRAACRSDRRRCRAAAARPAASSTTPSVRSDRSLCRGRGRRSWRCCPHPSPLPQAGEGAHGGGAAM